MSLLLALVAPPSGAALTGVAAVAEQGSLTPALSVPLTGQSGIAAVGGVSVEIVSVLTGTPATATTGTLVPIITPDPNAGKSGVSRLWLIEYYTRELARKQAAETTKKPQSLKSGAKRKASKAAQAAQAAKVEALAAQAESQLDALAQGVQDARAAMVFTARLLQQAQLRSEPEVDFLQLAIEYRKVQQQEDDDLLLLSMVI